MSDAFEMSEIVRKVRMYTYVSRYMQNVLASSLFSRALSPMKLPILYTLCYGLHMLLLVHSALSTHKRPNYR